MLRDGNVSRWSGCTKSLDVCRSRSVQNLQSDEKHGMAFRGTGPGPSLSSDLMELCEGEIGRVGMGRIGVVHELGLRPGWGRGRVEAMSLDLVGNI